MKYEKNATQRGFFYLIFGFGCLLAPAAAELIVFSQHPVPAIIPIVFWIVGISIGLLVSTLAIKMIKTGGTWIITIDHNGIEWQSPDESVDPSFSYSIDQMQAVEFNVKRNSLSGTGKRRYFIVKSDGSRQKLSPNSGLSQKKVAEELASIGVPKIHSRE